MRPFLQFVSRLLFGLVGCAALWQDLHAATGVIYYNQILSPTSPASLRRIHGNGSLDERVLVNLPVPAHPTVSRDGRRLLLTSPDPGRPFKLSQNVFLTDLATRSIQRITAFEDVSSVQGKLLTNDLGEVIGDRINSGYIIHTPYYKAFSPTGAEVVVMNLRKTGTVSRENIHSITNQDLATPEGAISGRFPVVETYAGDGRGPLGTYVYLGIERTGFNQGGDGVDWHPTLGEIVATLSSDIPATGNTGRTGMEGTVLAVFTTSGGASQLVRKLTAPSGRADAFFDATTLISVAYAEHDYAPAVSPNGQQVAYVRHTLRQDTRYDGAGIAPLPAICSIRVIHYDGTADHEVIRLAEGLWVTTVTWSPDSSEIAFDLAPQLVLNGWNSLAGDPTRSEVYAVGANAGTPRLIASVPAAFPTWGPALEPPVRPFVRVDRDGTRFLLEIDRLVPGSLFEVQGSIDVTNWESLGSFTAEGSTHFITITPDPNTASAIYRIRL